MVHPVNVLSHTDTQEGNDIFSRLRYITRSAALESLFPLLVSMGMTLGRVLKKDKLYKGQLSVHLVTKP